MTRWVVKTKQKYFNWQSGANCESCASLDWNLPSQNSFVTFQLKRIIMFVYILLFLWRVLQFKKDFIYEHPKHILKKWTVVIVCILSVSIFYESHLPLQEILRNQRHPAKVLNSEFCSCTHSKPHLQNISIDSKDFFTQTVQGSGHIYSKIKS